MPVCEQCGGELFFHEDGPDGRSNWYCDTCELFWDDKNGQPSGLPEKYGEGPGLRGYPPWSNT